MFGGQFYNKKYANSSCCDTASLLGAGANPLNINANIAKINESANFYNIFFTVGRAYFFCFACAHFCRGYFFSARAWCGAWQSS